MDGYLQKPSEMDDERLMAWARSFAEQPPTLDLMVEHAWARSIAAEMARRGLEVRR